MWWFRKKKKRKVEQLGRIYIRYAETWGPAWTRHALAGWLTPRSILAGVKVEGEFFLLGRYFVVSRPGTSDPASHIYWSITVKDSAMIRIRQETFRA